MSFAQIEKSLADLDKAGVPSVLLVEPGSVYGFFASLRQPGASESHVMAWGFDLQDVLRELARKLKAEEDVR